MGTVVVGLDGSEASRMAFHVAVNEAKTRHCRVRAVHAWPYPVSTIYQAVHVDVESLADSAKLWMAGEIDSLSKVYRDGFPVDVGTTELPGHAGSILVEQAADAELLVLGARGLGGVRGLMAGSVSTYCLHHIPCSLLVVPALSTEDA